MSTLYIRLQGFVGLFCGLYYLRINRSRKYLFKILLDISKLSSSGLYQTALPQTVQYSFFSCFPSIPGLYNSHTFKWSVPALAQDVWKGDSFPSPNSCQQTKGRKHRVNQSWQGARNGETWLPFPFIHPNSLYWGPLWARPYLGLGNRVIKGQSTYLCELTF